MSILTYTYSSFWFCFNRWRSTTTGRPATVTPPSTRTASPTLEASWTSCTWVTHNITFIMAVTAYIVFNQLVKPEHMYAYGIIPTVIIFSSQRYCLKYNGWNLKSYMMSLRSRINLRLSSLQLSLLSLYFRQSSLPHLVSVSFFWQLMTPAVALTLVLSHESIVFLWWRIVAEQSEGFRVTLWIHPFINDDCQSFAYADQQGYFVKVCNYPVWRSINLSIGER